MAHMMFGSIALESFTGVIKVTNSCDGSTIGHRVPSNEPVMVVGHVLPEGIVTLYDFVMIGADDFVYLRHGDESWWFAHDQHRGDLSPKILELCAGVGGMGIGASFVGGIPFVSVDHNELSCSHLRANNHGDVLQMDLTHPTSAKLIHMRFGASPGTVTFGFPCQPHSTQGHQLGSMDSRFQVFWHGLKVIFLTNAQSAILECVPAAGTHPEIVKGLQMLADVMDWDILTVNLDLQAQWPCRRARWWALLLPKEWHTYGLHSWPSTSPYQCVGDLFHCWGVWPDVEETELQLYAFELEAYLNADFGADKRLLEFGDKANTFLHSYGNALMGCPCGCRSNAMSLRSLQLRGLRGCFVQSAVHHNPRFLHPREMALLLGIPNSVNLNHPPRASLALMGLVASPLQMVWLYAHLRNNVAQALDQDVLPSPLEWLRAYQHELLRQTWTLFKRSSSIPQLLHLKDIDGSELVIASPTASSVAQLLHAQRICLGWNESGGITQDGQPLALHSLLNSMSGPYQLSIQSGPSDRPSPPANFTVGIRHEQNFTLVIVPAGQFLFQILRQHNIQDVNFLVDQQGKVYGADYRIWKPLNLRTLDPAMWPPTFAVRAAGHQEAAGGLHDGHISWTLASFLQLTPGLLKPMIIYPLTALQIIENQNACGLQLGHAFSKSDDRIICIFASGSHWALLWGQLHIDRLSWRYCDGLPGQATFTATQLAAHISNELSLDWSIEPHHLITQQDDHTCGAVALFHVGALLGFFGLPSRQAVLDLYAWLVHRPALGLFRGDPWIYGSGPVSIEPQAELAAILATKGVPSHLAAERASAALKKLGSMAVQTALTQTNPWAALKALTTRPGSNFQFVTKAELQDYISTKANSKHGATVPSHKKKDKKTSKDATVPSMALDPAVLQLDPSHFVDDEDDQLPQIPLAQVVADARGVALATLSEALPYLREVKHISADALGLLILDEVPSHLKGMATISAIRFPVTYLPTKDPLLIQGSLLQLGDHSVERKVIQDPVDMMDLADTKVLKLQMFRDELSNQWEQITTAPIRHLFQMVPLFRLCTAVTCDHRCGLFHAAVEDNIDQVVHEIWGRRFQNLEGRALPAPQAEVFLAFLRIASSALDDLLRVQVDGIYLEPRSDSTKATDVDYSVVWIPGANREAAVHRLKLTSHGLSLVRMKNRFGIRVCAIYEEVTHRELRPGDVYVKVEVSKIYRLHPLPHGLQRQQVVQLLKEWKWQAKPLQPARGSSEGGSWEVGAANEPPNNVLPAFNRDVLISLIKDKKEADRAPMVVGPLRAQRHLRSQASSSTSTTAPAASDPWQSPGQDPWQSWHGTTSSGSDRPAKRYEALADQLKTELNSSLQESLGAASVDSRRMHQLETDMEELKSHQATYHAWFQDTGTRLAKQEEQLTNLRTSVQQNHQDLQVVRAEVHTSADNLHQAMQVSFGSMKTDLSAELTHAVSSQMDRLEAMLSKRQRSEC